MVLVAVSDAVLADGPAGSDVAGQAAVEVRHGVGVLLGDGEQALAQPLGHVQRDSVPVLLVVCGKGNKAHYYYYHHHLLLLLTNKNYYYYYDKNYYYYY